MLYRIGYWENLHQKSDETLAQTAQGCGSVTIPGGVQEKGRRGTEGQDLVGNFGGWLMVGLDYLGTLLHSY